MTWLLTSLNIPLVLAYAKYVKAITYAKVKTDKVDSHTLWIPGIGKMNAFTILLEIDDIKRFPDLKNFFSYSRLAPSARNSAGKSKQRSSKDGNKYLNMAFSDAAIHAVQYYPVIRKYHNSLLRKKNKQIAKTIVAKEIASIVFYVLKNKSDFNNTFKGHQMEEKSLQWPRVVSPCA